MSNEELNECPCCGANPPGPLYKAAIEASSLGPRPNLASLLSMIMHQLGNTYASGVNGEEIDLAYVREIEDGITKLYHAAQAASPAAPSPAHEGSEVAPWPDFLGQSIQHGARLLHPQDGNEFVAVRLHGHADESDAWRAVYDDGTVSRLCLQIGDKGQAVLASAPQAQPSVRDAVLEEARQACFLLMKPGATYARTIAGCMAAIDDLKTDKGASNG
jgi:hypothetical protein